MKNYYCPGVVGIKLSKSSGLRILVVGSYGTVWVMRGVRGARGPRGASAR